MGDGPAVAVLDPVVGAEAQPAVVVAGDDGVADVARLPSAKAHLRAGVASGEAVGLGALVELGDQVAGGGEHERVEPRPRSSAQAVKTSCGDGGEVADVDPVVVEVEPERLGVPVAQGQGGGGFDGVGEPHQLGQVQRAVGGGDVPQDAAGADRGELLVVPDQPDLPPRAVTKATAVSRERVSAIPASSIMTKVVARSRAAQSGRSPVVSDQVSLARVSVVAPVCSPSTAAAAAEGASPITVPPSSAQAAVRARMAVVFPAPAGAIASWSRAPEVAICGDQGGLSGVEGGPVGGLLEQRHLDGVGVGAVPVGDAGGVDEALLGGQDLAAGVERRSRRPRRRWTRRRAATPAGSSMPSPAGVEPHRAALRMWSVTRSTTRVDVLGGQVRGAHLAVRLGAHVPDLPGRAAVPASRRGPARRCPATHAASAIVVVSAAGARAVGTIDATAPQSAEDRFGLLAPGGALLGQGAWFVLGVAGLQGGLLGQQDRLHHGRRAAVVALERGRQLAAAGLDAGPPGRPALVQGRVDTDHFTDRALAPLGAGTLGEDQPEAGRAGASPGRCCRSRRR